MDRLRIGLIGYGGFGRLLHHTWEADGGARVVASLDGCPEGVPRVAGWREVLGRPDVDLVAVATLPGLHAQMGAAVLNAGKHLLVEKPIAIDLAGADGLIAARDRSGCVAAVDFMLRFTSSRRSSRGGVVVTILSQQLFAFDGGYVNGVVAALGGKAVPWLVLPAWAMPSVARLDRSRRPPRPRRPRRCGQRIHRPRRPRSRRLSRLP